MMKIVCCKCSTEYMIHEDIVEQFGISGCTACLVKENRECLSKILTNLHIIRSYGISVCSSCHDTIDDINKRICDYCRVKHGIDPLLTVG